MKTPKYILRQKTNWRVRVYHHHKAYASKNFLFRKYNGIKAALTAALIYRDNKLDELDMLEYVNRPRSPNLRTSRPATVIIGLERAAHRSICWKAQLSSKPQKKAHFAISKYGEKEAFLLACEARYKAHGTLIIVNRAALPCFPGAPSRLMRGRGK